MLRCLSVKVIGWKNWTLEKKMQNYQKQNSNITWNPENVFSGTAWYYARYRPGYPEALCKLLRKKFSLNLSSRILDLGCGTGQIALPLAPYVNEVLAIDPLEEMLDEGKKLATIQRIDNIQWLKGESGNLTQIVKPIGVINLTVIARAFHWMDREQTLKDLYFLTQLGGGIAIISDSGPRDGQKTPWKEVIDRVVKKWLGEERKAGTDGTYAHPQRRFGADIQDSDFRDMEIATFKLDRSWSLDHIAGYLYSTSSSSIPVLGDKKEAFEADLRTQLLSLEPSGMFTENVTVEVIMAWKN